MKNKKFISLVGAAALLANMALVAVASAEDTTGDVTVGGGSLVFESVPGAQTLATVCTSASTDSACTAETWGNAVRWSDTRDTGANYNVQADMTNMSNGIDTIPYTGVQIRVTGTPTTSGTYGGSCTTGMTAQTVSNFFNGTGGTSNPQNLVQASGAESILDCQVIPETNVTVPAYNSTGNYVGTMTFSVI